MKLKAAIVAVSSLFLSALCVMAAPTANEALSVLTEGNIRYATGAPIHPNQDAARRAATAPGQAPIASILACSDSRVPVEVLFDQGIGDTFVVRVAGNVSDTDEIGSIEYGVGHLHTPLLVILGHSSCGAVKAVLEGAEVHGSIPKLVDNIIPAVTQAKRSSLVGAALVAEAVKTNVWTSIDDLFKNSDEVRSLVQAGKLTVIGAVYDLESGKVNWMGVHPEQTRLLAYKSVEAHEEATKEHEPEPVAKAHESVPVAAPTVEIKPTNMVPWIVGGMLGVLLLGFAIQSFSMNGMQSWTVRTRLLGGFGLMAGLLAIVGIVAYTGIHNSKEGFMLYRADARFSVLAGRIQANFLEMRIAAKDFVISKRSHDIEEYNTRKGKVVSFIEEASSKISSPELSHLPLRTPLDSVKTGIEEHAALFQQLTKAPNAAAAADISKRMAGVGESIDHAAEKLKLEVLAEQNHNGPHVQNHMDETQTTTIWICIGAILLAIQSAFAISRSITIPLQEIADQIEDSTNQVVDSTGELAETSQQLAQGSVEQAASLTETSASLEEISAMAKRSTQNAEDGTNLGKQARASATSGLGSISELGRTLNSIKVAIAEMQAAVSETQASSQEIGKIIKTIDEIAFQTNLLALNAAVEAARAGEAGMGFAVVADEVRSLAQRSAQAAKDTADKIEVAIKRSELGGVASGKVVKSLSEVEATAALIEQAFNGIADQINSLDSVIASIAAASQEQSYGISQVNEAIAQLDSVTQTNAGSAEKNASSSEEMSRQANHVQEMVEELQILLGGHQSQQAPPARAKTKPPTGGRKNAKAALPSRSASRISEKASKRVGGDSNGFRDF